VYACCKGRPQQGRSCWWLLGLARQLKEAGRTDQMMWAGSGVHRGVGQEEVGQAGMGQEKVG